VLTADWHKSDFSPLMNTDKKDQLSVDTMAQSDVLSVRISADGIDVLLAAQKPVRQRPLFTQQPQQQVLGFYIRAADWLAS
jgi:hypothetical protein